MRCRAPRHKLSESVVNAASRRSVMIMHTWMHWFWITTVYFKGFLLFTAHAISLSSVSHLSVAGAGLLDGETTPLTPDSYNGTDSSQVGIDPNVTSPVDDGSSTAETTPELVSPSPQEGTEEPTTSEEPPKVPFGATSDAEDVYAGGALDVFQYPMKKFTKYSHLKYGKARGKGKSEEGGGEGRRLESVKLVEEKLNISISLASGSEVDKTGSTEGETSEVPTSFAPIGKLENETSEEGGGGKERKVTVEVSTKKPEVLPVPTEPQKEIEVPNNETLVIENKVEESGSYTTVEPFAVRNRVAAATSAQNYEVEQTEMNAGSITGITLGILVVFSLFGAVSFVFYRRRYLNKPQVLHDKCSNLDSSGYIDETSLRENSEEMYSLDNDSFLNSLEAMTIQNYWTESVKHTKL